MGSKPIPIPLFFMRLPPSSSLILVSLVVSSSLSALAAPVRGSKEDSSSYAPAAVLLAVLLAQQHAPIPPSSDDTQDDTIGQPNKNLQARNLVDKVTAPLAVPPELGKAIPDILLAILDPLVGKDTPKVPGETFDPMKSLVLTVKTTWAEEVDEGGDDATSEDSSMRPSPAAGHHDQGAPVAGPNPSAGFLRQPSLPRGLAGRQADGEAGGGSGSGSGGGNVPWPGCPP